ncbi:hypothetical protein SDJN02_05995, partial [Cucurbita argyrosperma subsp. argyrosperma]
MDEKKRGKKDRNQWWVAGGPLKAAPETKDGTGWVQFLLPNPLPPIYFLLDEHFQRRSSSYLSYQYNPKISNESSVRLEGEVEVEEEEEEEEEEEFSLSSCFSSDSSPTIHLQRRGLCIWRLKEGDIGCEVLVCEVDEIGCPVVGIGIGIGCGGGGEVLGVFVLVFVCVCGASVVR